MNEQEQEEEEEDELVEDDEAGKREMSLCHRPCATLPCTVGRSLVRQF